MIPNNKHHNMIKARVAETIIKEMFKENGYLVYENGMERNKPEIMDHVKNNNSKVSKDIRFSPDFIVVKPNSGELFYLEVKFRKEGKFTKEELPANYTYQNAHFVIVSKSNIFWITYDQLAKGNYTSTKSVFYIENSTLFNLQPEIIERYKKYVSDFFANID